MNYYFLLAGVLSGMLTLVHLFAGGRSIAAPLLAAKDIDTSAKYVNYYCWHLVTFNLAFMAAIFVLAARTPEQPVLAWLGVAQAGFFFLWGVSMPLWKGVSYKDVPQGWFFAPVTALGIIGLY